MNTILLIVNRSLRQHLLSTCVTSISVGLACGLLMAVFAIQAQTYEAMTAGATRFDAVLGARGSQLQLVLNAVFHLDVSPGNLPWKMYMFIKNDPHVLKAIPYAVGDNYRGFRIVATTSELFGYKATGKNFELQKGQFFDPEKREAVLGSFAADKTNLKIGSVFNAYHGIVFEEKMKHPEQFTVVGILKPTNTPADRAIWTPLDSFYRLSGHVLRGLAGRGYVAKGSEAIPDEYKEVSAVMVKFKSPQMGVFYDQMINRQGKVATLAWPIEKVMADFLNKIGWFHKILTILAYVIAVVAAGAILAGIYNSMNERRREFAILRVLGAHRLNIFTVIIMEACVIAFNGVIIGFVIYGLVLSVASVIIRSGTGVVIEVFRFHPVFIGAPIGIIVLGSLAGIIPAMKAYQSPVAENLAPQS